VPRGTWNDLFLALSGALCSTGVALTLVPQIVATVSSLVGTGSVQKDRSTAERTARRYASRARHTGMRALRTKWPSVAIAVSAVAGWDPDAVREQNKEQVAAAVEEMRRTIAGAADRLILVSSECGLGKSRAALDVAEQRAASNLKTGISAPTNELAVQHFRDLRDRGVPVRRLFGPLSVTGPDECIHRKRALPLVNGGQSLHREFCVGRKGTSKCERYDRCDIRDGVEGDEGAHVVVTTHALLGALTAEVGQRGLLVIDEPPAPVISESLTSDDLDNLMDQREAFNQLYTISMQPVVDTARSYRTEESQEADEVFGGITGLGNAFPPGWKGTSPPLKSDRILMIRKGFKNDSASEGAASRVYKVLYEVAAAANGAPQPEDPGDLLSRRVLIRYQKIEGKEGRGDLCITRMDRALERAVTRTISVGGGTVILDANAETHRAMYERVVGYPLECKKFAALDGSNIRRMRVDMRASRRVMLPHGRIALEALQRALAAVRGWMEIEGMLLDRDGRYGLITFKPLAIALKAAKGEELPEGSWRSEWGDLRECIGAIQQVFAIFGDEGSAERPPSEYLTRLEIGWYGAVRGKNNMKDLDGVITVGDPRVNLGSALESAGFVGFDGTAADQYNHALCVDELEQAHGRLRTVHRDRPGRSLHVGRVTPGGTGWERRTVVDGWDEEAPGYETNPTDVIDEFRELLLRVHTSSGWSLRELAERIPVGVSAIKAYMYDGVAIPDHVAVRLLQLLSEIGAERPE